MKTHNRLSAIFVSLIIFSVFALPHFSFAASDVTGWNKVKWGDPISKVEKLYGSLEFCAGLGKMKGYCPKKYIVIMDVSFRVIFYFDKDKGLLRVVLNSINAGPKLSDCREFTTWITKALMAKYELPDDTPDDTILSSWTRLSGYIFFHKYSGIDKKNNKPYCHIEIHYVCNQDKNKL